MANLVAKADGVVSDKEAAVLHSIQHQLDTHLRSIPYAEHDHSHAQQSGANAVHEIRAGAQELRKKCDLESSSPPPLPQEAKPKISLDEARGRTG